jgi:hypothetical protein
VDLAFLFLFSFIFLSPGFLQHGGRWGYPFGDTIPACRKRKEKEKEAYSVRTLVMAKANAVDLASPLKYDHGGNFSFLFLFLFSFIFLSPGFLQHGGRWGYPFGDTIQKEAYSVRTLVMAQGECGGFGFPPKI